MDYLITFSVYLTALAICGAAVRFGDRPLRLTAIVYMAGWILTTLLAHRVRLGLLDVPVTVIDLGTSLTLVWISLRWRRLWCAALAGEALVTTLIPIVSLFYANSVSRYARMAASNMVAIVQLVTLVVAIVVTLRARRQGEEDAVRA